MIALSDLNAQKSTLLSVVDGWSSQRLSRRPAIGRWSAAEVFDHLVKTEERILQAAKQGLTRPHRVGVSDRLRTAFLCKVFESDRQVQVPSSATVVLPDDAPCMSKVCDRWGAVREELAAFHAPLSPAQMRHGLFKHPVGGWMALPDIIRFFYVHMLHHRFQLDRLSAETRSL